MNNLKQLLIELNKAHSILRRCENGTDSYKKYESMTENLSENILELIGKPEGLSSEDAEKLFKENKLNSKYAWSLGNGDWC